MSTLNIQFHIKLTKFPQIFVLLIYRKIFVGTQKRVRNSHGKRVIVVRAIEVLLYLVCVSPYPLNESAILNIAL